MFRSWRLHLTEAADAFRAGRLDEAERVICGSDLRQYRPGKELAVAVAAKIAQRAKRRILAGEMSTGWGDLQTACSLSGESEELLALRQELIDHVLQAAEADLAAGEPAKAVSRLESLERRAAAPEAVRTLKEAARRLVAADKQFRRGEFGRDPSAARAGSQKGTGLCRVIDGRFMLWVDGVGGYLVCLPDSVCWGWPRRGTRSISRSWATCPGSTPGSAARTAT